MPRDVSGASPRRIVITGSECTGKTSLARALALELDALWLPEFARAYAESKAGPLDARDVEPIALGQIRAEDEAVERTRDAGGSILVLDTDLVSTTVYARHYYGACPPWIDEAALARRGDLYLLCDVDVPWVSDAARDRPHLRDEIHATFIDALERLGARWAPVRGLGDLRLEVARAAVREIVRGTR